MRSTDKIKEVRKSAHLRAFDPERAFNLRLAWPRSLLSLAEKHASLPAQKLEARRQYIVSLCAAFEIFWRDFIKICVDDAEISPQQLQHLAKPSISINDVAYILDRRVTLGELISCSYTFQSCETVNRAFTEIFRLNAFEELKKEKWEFRERHKTGPIARTVTGEDVLLQSVQISKCFQVRHETVHNIGAVYRPSLAQLGEFERAMIIFNTFLSRLIARHVLIMISIPNAIRSGQKPADLSRMKDRVLTRMVRTWVMGRFKTKILPRSTRRPQKPTRKRRPNTPDNSSGE